MELDRPIDITTEQRKTILALLARHLPNTTAWVYGSRVKWTSTPKSDLDLVIFATPEQSGRVSDLREAFEESNLPFRVDLFVWDDVQEPFRKQIEAEHVELVERREPSVVGERRDTAYGLINADFVENRLADLCDPVSGIQTGPFGSQLHNKDYVPVGTPIITVEHLGENRILHEGLPCVSEKDRLRLSKYCLQKDDIVFSRVGSVDRRALVRNGEDGWLFSGRCLRVRPNSNCIDAAFLSYFFGLPSFKEHIRAVAVGATMPSLNTQILRNIRVPHPKSLEEQRSIAQVLGTLDDKIELNRQLNESLEKMGRALFKSWFVDFDPVHAKGTLKKRHATPPQGASDWSVERARAYLERMDPNIAAMFPDSFVDSELGPIPAGWKCGVLDDVVELLSGGTPKTSVAEYWDGNIPWYTAKDAPSLSDVFVLETERSITQAGVENSAAKILPAQTTIVTARGTVGRLACLGRPMAMNQTCYGIRGARGFPDFFTYWNARMTVDELRQRTHGTIFDTITRQTFKLVNSIIPLVELAGEFEKTILPVMRGILSNLHESASLATQRATLLPKLMSGEVRIKDVTSP